MKKVHSLILGLVVFLLLTGCGAARSVSPAEGANEFEFEYVPQDQSNDIDIIIETNEGTLRTSSEEAFWHYDQAEELPEYIIITNYAIGEEIFRLHIHLHASKKPAE